MMLSSTWRSNVIGSMLILCAVVAGGCVQCLSFLPVGGRYTNNRECQYHISIVAADFH